MGRGTSPQGRQVRDLIWAPDDGMVEELVVQAESNLAVECRLQALVAEGC